MPTPTPRNTSRHADVIAMLQHHQHTALTQARAAADPLDALALRGWAAQLDRAIDALTTRS